MMSNQVLTLFHRELFSLAKSINVNIVKDICASEENVKNMDVKWKLLPNAQTFCSRYEEAKCIVQPSRCCWIACSSSLASITNGEESWQWNSEIWRAILCSYSFQMEQLVVLLATVWLSFSWEAVAYAWARSSSICLDKLMHSICMPIC